MQANRANRKHKTELETRLDKTVEKRETANKNNNNNSEELTARKTRNIKTKTKKKAHTEQNVRWSSVSGAGPRFGSLHFGLSLAVSVFLSLFLSFRLALLHSL